MKKVFFAILAVAALAAAVSCNKDDKDVIPENTVTLNGASYEIVHAAFRQESSDEYHIDLDAKESAVHGFGYFHYNGKSVDYKDDSPFMSLEFNYFSGGNYEVKIKSGTVTVSPGAGNTIIIFADCTCEDGKPFKLNVQLIEDK